MATSFNYNNMQIHMKNLDADFAYFAQTLKKANDMVNDFVNVSVSSSIYGEKAKKVLNLWNQNASTFGDFYQNFENWSALMINTANEYHKFEDSVFSSHQTTGDTADDVAKSRKNVGALAGTSQVAGGDTTSNGSFTLSDGSTIQYLMDEQNNTYALINKNGIVTKRVFHEDGTHTDYDLQSSIPTNVLPIETLDDVVTVSSGQKVNLNGEDCYFLMRDGKGNDYYVTSTDADAQVYTYDGEKLVPFVEDGYKTRDVFVKKIHNLKTGSQWSVTYNNGTSPYQEVGTEIDRTFTEGAKFADHTNIVYDQGYLQKNKITLKQFEQEGMNLGSKELPSVLYLEPGQSIRSSAIRNNIPNVIEGGDTGAYLVYNPEKQAYFKLDENGSYNSGNEERTYYYISAKDLLSNQTTLTK